MRILEKNKKSTKNSYRKSTIFRNFSSKEAKTLQETCRKTNIFKKNVEIIRRLFLANKKSDSYNNRARCLKRKRRYKKWGS